MFRRLAGRKIWRLLVCSLAPVLFVGLLAANHGSCEHRVSRCAGQGQETFTARRKRTVVPVLLVLRLRLGLVVLLVFLSFFFLRFVLVVGAVVAAAVAVVAVFAIVAAVLLALREHPRESQEERARVECSPGPAPAHAHLGEARQWSRSPDG